MNPPVCIMYDVLLGWTMEVPQKHNITRVVFNTYGAFALTLLRYAWISASHNALEKEGDSIVLSLDLPTPLRLHKHEIDTMLLDPFMLEVLERLQSLNQGEGMLINTYEQVEPEYLQHLRNLTGKKIFLTEEQSKALASGLEASGQPFIWAIKVSPKLEPRTSDTTDLLLRKYLPEGFLERTKNRGLFI
ncbi:hypothetical protein SUGI_0073660 [Cryptomeria japonica]|nr:hypothetical protein SUGI_0073660 [Cryptomeria japonica]